MPSRLLCFCTTKEDQHLLHHPHAHTFCKQIISLQAARVTLVDLTTKHFTAPYQTLFIYNHCQIAITQPSKMAADKSELNSQPHPVIVLKLGGSSSGAVSTGNITNPKNSNSTSSAGSTESLGSAKEDKGDKSVSSTTTTDVPKREEHSSTISQSKSPEEHDQSKVSEENDASPFQTVQVKHEPTSGEGGQQDTDNHALLSLDIPSPSIPDTATGGNAQQQLRSAPATTQSSQQPGMQLTDAFAYLDKVRTEFSDQPEVYNRFLQVMREFKANTIDANGVIARVVHLFKGHRALILGFNAFLPRTHHIDPNLTDFTHLMYPQHQQQQSPIGQAQSRLGPRSANPIPPPNLPSPSPNWLMEIQQQPRLAPALPQSSTYHHYYSPGSINSVRSSIPQQQQQPVLAPQPPPPLAPLHQQLPPQPHPSMNFGPSPPGQRRPMSQQPPFQAIPSNSTPSNTSGNQFNRAVAFVKKIKHRYSNDSETYRTFLNCLHAFHRDQRSVPDVCRQVSGLFRDAPDLMEEFLQFLPTNNANITEDIETAITNRKRPYRPTPSQPPIIRTQEETVFFEKVRRYLGSRAVYAEFLKCLSLYSQDILKLRDLMQLVNGFIGGATDLIEWFKRYIGVTSSVQEDQTIQALPQSPQRERERERVGELYSSMPELNLAACKKFGSYRIYPNTYRLVQASGRTPLCLEVLNDTMVSTASFDSEDAGFVSSKKNLYEEALFRCEDERFEMDLLIEHNMATIAILEPLAKKIEVMSEEDRNGLKLDAALSGHSRTIYRKAIKRVYGTERGDEFYKALQEKPVAAVPVVLARLRQKDAEWRRVQRDWSRVWRDVHAKNYYKALDHQGIDFKLADKKTFSVKAFVSEIEAMKGGENVGMGTRLKFDVLPTLPMGSVKLELQAPSNNDVLGDVQMLLLHAVKHSATTYSGNDRRDLARLFAQLPSELFGTDPIRTSDPNAVDEGDSSEEERATTRRQARRLALIEPMPSTIKDGKEYPSSGQNPQIIYANNIIYALLRIIHLACERLSLMRTFSVQANDQPYHTEKANVVASFLDLQSTGITAEKSSNFYAVLKDLLSHLLVGPERGGIDAGNFEEQIRFMFGTAAYPMYTFDKLTQAALRQAHACLTESAALLQQYHQWRTNLATNGHSEYTYRLAAESIVGPRDNLFRIECFRDLSLKIYLLERVQGPGSTLTDLPSIPTTSVEQRWSAYVDDFVRMERIDPHYCLRMPFLPRTAQSSRSPIVDYRLQCKICVNTYRLFHIAHTEDFIFGGRGSDAVKLRYNKKKAEERLVRLFNV